MAAYEASLGRKTSTNYPLVNFLMATDADFFIGALGSTWCFLIDGMRNTGGKRHLLGSLPSPPAFGHTHTKHAGDLRLLRTTHTSEFLALRANWMTASCFVSDLKGFGHLYGSYSASSAGEMVSSVCFPMTIHEHASAATCVMNALTIQAFQIG
ncbi:hypothetical protein ACLOJK_011400 [Asimina triloba]